jgi:hypothetical protein
MRPSVRALFAGIVDYAGLFPPARLPLEEAIRNYARYRQEPESWMLGRFVCPAARLPDLGLLVDELFGGKARLGVSVLGRAGKDNDDFFNNLRADLQLIAEFTARHKAHVLVDVLEFRLPSDVVGPARSRPCEELLVRAVDLLEERGPRSLATFFVESTPPSEWQRSVQSVIRALANLNHIKTSRARTRRFEGGFKLRCGPSELAPPPTADQVAFTLAACLLEQVPLKFTAGLHHPLHRYDSTSQTHVHGFLNVFVAAALGHARQLSEEHLRTIIEDEDPADFRFDDHALHWRDWSASVADITAARSKAAVSFGSCSFDEPRDDLRAMGLLD